MAGSRSLKTRWSRSGLYFFLGLTSFFIVVPFVWVFLTSFKLSSEIVTETPKLFPTAWTLENYLKLPKVAPFLRFFLNSIIVSGVSTIFIALGSAACGYVFAKYRFRGRDFLFSLVISTILIPLQTYIVPLYLLTWKLGWINSYQGFADRGHLHRELGLHLEFVHLAPDRSKLNGYVHHGVGAHVFSKGVRGGLRWGHGSLRDYPAAWLGGP